jgi:hypothetical protein
VQKIRGPFHKSLGALGWIVVKLESLLKNRRLRKYFAERFKGSSVKTRGLRGSTLLTERTFFFCPRYGLGQELEVNHRIKGIDE